MSWQLLSHVVPIQVLNEGEWGTFYLREGKKGAGDDQRFFCDLTIHSSFGSVAYFWSHMGSTAREFLSQCDCDYLMGKLYGTNSHVFDYDATVEAFRKSICEERRRDDLGHGEARNIWNALKVIGHATSPEEFMREMFDDSEFDEDKFAFIEWCQPAEAPWRTRLNPQAVGLWEKLWPDFLAALQSLHDNRDLPT